MKGDSRRACVQESKRDDINGYAIIQRVKELSGGMVEWADGMLYPVLHWLEDQRLVRSRWAKSESDRKRKYYSLQSEGRQALRQQKEQWTLGYTTTFLVGALGICFVGQRCFSDFSQ